MQFQLDTRLREAIAQMTASSSSQHVRMEVVFSILKENTRGAVETCLHAEPQILPHAPIIVMDCDLTFSSAPYMALLWRYLGTSASKREVLVAAGHTPTTLSVGDSKEKEEERVTVNGLLVYFESSAPRYSFASLEGDDVTPAPSNGPSVAISPFVTKTAEKIPISNHALIGAYGFGSGELFVAASKRLMLLPIDPAVGRKEYYISLLFNDVLQVPAASHEGGRSVVVAVPKDTYFSFGTPEELEAYLQGKDRSNV